MRESLRFGHAKGALDGFFEWETNDESSIARYGLYFDRASEFLRHDAVHNLKPKAGSRALRLGGKECFKYARKGLGGDTATMILNANS